MPIRKLEPKNVWTNFYSLTQIPRPSGHTAQVADFLVKLGKAHYALISEALFNTVNRLGQFFLTRILFRILEKTHLNRFVRAHKRSKSYTDASY